MSESAAMSRRERQQIALRREVIETALAQLDEGGPTAINWRALARAAGVSPSSLYTYFESLDALYTAVILEIYDEMARAVRDEIAAVNHRPTSAKRFRAAAAGYRAYAKRHPARFTLVFTDVLPGYAAPAGGPTIDAQVRVVRPVLAAVAVSLGRNDDDVASWSAADRAALIGAWAQLHGFVTLEVNHHLVWLDDVDDLFDRVVATISPTR
jgi:AcrR family transcriptional regulator